MSGISALDQVADPAVRRDDELEPARGAPAIAWLGSWMAILGAIRLACAITEYIHACREAFGSGLVAGWGWGRFFNENPPIHMLIGAWPLILGVALRRTRWPDLVKAGALTLLILAIGGGLTALADWGQMGGSSVAIGSFRVPRLPWDQLGVTGMAMAVAGSVQLLLEFATAIWASVLAFRRVGAAAPGTDRRDSARRSRFGRMALYVSVAFVALTIRLPAWTTVLEFVTQSQWIREAILRDDFSRIRAVRPGPGPASAWAVAAQELYGEGEQAWREGRYAVSSEKYTRLAAQLESIPTATMSPTERRIASLAFNNYAWLLATCPETAFRDAQASVNYARRALEIMPNDANTWNTLGVSYFRLGSWDEARSALYRSMELRNEGDSFDWFFLAMIHAKLGHKERAHEWYDQAVKWSHMHRPGDGELYQFEVEAAEVLGLPRPERQAAPPGPTGQPFEYRRLIPRTPHWRG